MFKDFECVFLPLFEPKSVRNEYAIALKSREISKNHFREQGHVLEKVSPCWLRILELI